MLRLNGPERFLLNARGQDIDAKTRTFADWLSAPIGHTSQDSRFEVRRATHDWQKYCSCRNPQYAATLSKWFGIPDVDLDIVAPHIDNFTLRDLGFMV